MLSRGSRVGSRENSSPETVRAPSASRGLSDALGDSS